LVTLSFFNFITTKALFFFSNNSHINLYKDVLKIENQTSFYVGFEIVPFSLYK
jgi:hypothetical protein